MQLAIHDGARREPRLSGRAFVVVGRRMEAQRDSAAPARRASARDRRARGAPLDDRAALPFVAVRQRDDDTGTSAPVRPGLTRRRRGSAWRIESRLGQSVPAPDPPRNLEAGEISAENLVGVCASLGELRRPDHAQADAVARPVAVEPIVPASRRSSNAVLLMCCQPSVRPTTTRRSCPEICPASARRARSRATRPDALRDAIRTSRRSPRNPAACSARSRSASREVRRPRRRAAARIVVLRRQIRRILRARARRPTAVRCGRRTTRCSRRGGRAVAQQSTARPSRCAARSVAAVAVRTTWQCVWSQRSKPSARCRPRLASANVRTVIASASSAAGWLSRAASPASTRATYVSSGIVVTV